MNCPTPPESRRSSIRNRAEPEAWFDRRDTPPVEQCAPSEPLSRVSEPHAQKRLHFAVGTHEAPSRGKPNIAQRGSGRTLTEQEDDGEEIASPEEVPDVLCERSLKPRCGLLEQSSRVDSAGINCPPSKSSTHTSNFSSNGSSCSTKQYAGEVSNSGVTRASTFASTEPALTRASTLASSILDDSLPNLPLCFSPLPLTDPRVLPYPSDLKLSIGSIDSVVQCVRNFKKVNTDPGLSQHTEVLLNLAAVIADIAATKSLNSDHMEIDQPRQGESLAIKDAHGLLVNENVPLEPDTNPTIMLRSSSQPSAMSEAIEHFGIVPRHDGLPHLTQSSSDLKDHLVPDGSDFDSEFDDRATENSFTTTPTWEDEHAWRARQEIPVLLQLQEKLVDLMCTRYLETLDLNDARFTACTPGPSGRTRTNQPSASTPAGGAPPNNGRKRKTRDDENVNDGSGDEEEDDGNNKKRRGAQTPKQSTKGDQSLAACPYYKDNSWRYSYRNCRQDGRERDHRKCASATIRPESFRLKQHLLRHHKRPDYYCPRCFYKFGNDSELEVHAQKEGSEQCRPQPCPWPELMTSKQFNDIKALSTSGEFVDYYYKVWDILFPGKTRPASIWLDDIQENLGLSQARDFWLVNARPELQPLIPPARELPQGYQPEWTTEDGLEVYLNRIALRLWPLVYHVAELLANQIPTTAPGAIDEIAQQVSGDARVQYQPHQPATTTNVPPVQYYGFNMEQPMATANTMPFRHQDLHFQRAPSHYNNAVHPLIPEPAPTEIPINANSNLFPSWERPTPDLSVSRTDEESSQEPQYPRDPFLQPGEELPLGSYLPVLVPQQEYLLPQGTGSQFANDRVEPVQFGQAANFSGGHLGLGEGQFYIPNIENGQQLSDSNKSGSTEQQDGWGYNAHGFQSQ